MLSGVRDLGFNEAAERTNPAFADGFLGTPITWRRGGGSHSAVEGVGLGVSKMFGIVRVSATFASGIPSENAAAKRAFLGI